MNQEVFITDMELVKNYRVEKYIFKLLSESGNYWYDVYESSKNYNTPYGKYVPFVTTTQTFCFWSKDWKQMVAVCRYGKKEIDMEYPLLVEFEDSEIPINYDELFEKHPHLLDIPCEETLRRRGISYIKTPIMRGVKTKWGKVGDEIECEEFYYHSRGTWDYLSNDDFKPFIDKKRNRLIHNFFEVPINFKEQLYSKGFIIVDKFTHDVLKVIVIDDKIEFVKFEF